MSTITGMLVTEDGLIDIGGPSEVDVATLTCVWVFARFTGPTTVCGLIAFYPPALADMVGRAASFMALEHSVLMGGDTIKVNFQIKLK